MNTTEVDLLWTGSSAGLPAILNYAVSLGLDAVVEVSVLIIHLIPTGAFVGDGTVCRAC